MGVQETTRDVPISEAGHRLMTACAAVERQLAVFAGRTDVVAAACAEFETAAPSCTDGLIEPLERLADAVAGARSEAVAAPVLALIDRIADDEVLVGLFPRLLGARAAPLRAKVVDVALDRLTRDVSEDVVLALAVALEGDPRGRDPALLDRMARLVEDRSELLESNRPDTLRRLAARVLDRDGNPADPELASRLLGDRAYRVLAPYLDFTRATVADIVALTPRQPPPCLESFQSAESRLGRTELGRLLGELGWDRVAFGIEVEHFVGLAADHGLPFIVTDAEAELLDRVPGLSRRWERWLAVARGSGDRTGAGAMPDRQAVDRFRRSNLCHAELLGELMTMAPLSGARARRMMAMTKSLADDFTSLFASVDDDATRLVELVERLTRPLERVLAEIGDDDPVPATVAHAILAFEDPVRLDEVTTVHGLKRLLHQRGLRAAFRRFRGASGADRTVDLAVWQTGRPMTVARRLRYVDLESEDDLSLPLVVRLVATAFGRQLLHGLDRLPDVEAFCYGNEVQAYINFRNHPAFLRVDLAPPLRGGMLDLEYFAVSQYEIDQHPDVELPAIRAAFDAFDLDLEVDGVRLHARYDKERALDLGQLVERVEEVLCLVPYLMDLDWTIGNLDYPAPVRLEIARAWARRLRTWGVLPVSRVLTGDRRRVLADREHDPAGDREIAWNGRGEYRDVLGAAPSGDLLGRLRAALSERGMVPVDRWPRGGPWTAGQLAFERALLEPLRDAVRAGYLENVRGSLRQVARDRARRQHEAVIVAERLLEGGESLHRALATARLIRPVEPHLRFRATGAVAGGAVEEAVLWLSTGRATVVVLRDPGGSTRLAIVCDGSLFVQRRDEDDGRWRLAREIAPEELERRLRRDTYPVVAPGTIEDGSALVAELRSGAPGSANVPVLDERAVVGIAAAPGRAAGPVRLGIAGRQPEGLDGAVLVAPSVAPEDAPYLQHAAAIVSTGGGVLSHAGLIALELGRPSLVVDGTWRNEDDTQLALVLHRETYRDETLEVGGLEVVCHRGLRVSEEELLDGDLVEVDADQDRLVLLGRDLVVRTAWAALGEVKSRGALLATTHDDVGVLAHRGRLLKAVHQLERLAERITSPTLVRFLIWELLVELPAAAGAPARPAVRRVLQSLQTAAPSPELVHAATEWCLTELERRLSQRMAVARELVAGVRTPFEPLLVRAAVHRLAAAVAEARELTGRGPSTGLEEDLNRLDAEIHERLSQQRARALVALGDAREDPVVVRSALTRLAVLDGVIGPLPEAGAEIAAARARLSVIEDGVRSSCREHWVVDGAEIGIDAAAEVGGKAAALGELLRILGGAVPFFFVVTRYAFQQLVATRLRDSNETLDRHIRSALVVAERDPAAASRTIRELWERVSLPAELEESVRSSVRRAESATDGVIAFAVRSSGLEEDSTVSAWAGQFDTFLGVVGADEVLRCLRLAWAGLWTERALAHRRHHGARDELPGGGVVVQRMVSSRVSGVAHTAAVASGRPDEMIVNVGLGLGEGVVAGTVEVDHVVVAKASTDVGGTLRFQYVVGDKREQVVADPNRPGETRRVPTLAHQRLRPALEYRELETLVMTALRLEEIWGEPLDIEFAFEGPDLRILQVRPVPAVHDTVATMLAAWPLDGRSR
ncbi:MAG: PEP/pyruvate-binding domain-containing protein [Holophagae bacterium]|jgi:phosphohistidine swiveling domain-containing protein